MRDRGEDGKEVLAAIHRDIRHIVEWVCTESRSATRHLPHSVSLCKHPSKTQRHFAAQHQPFKVRVLAPRRTACTNSSRASTSRQVASVSHAEEAAAAPIHRHCAVRSRGLQRSRRKTHSREVDALPSHPPPPTAYPGVANHPDQTLFSMVEQY